MNRKGRLTNVDKYTIQGMVADEKSPEEISKALGRKPETIQKYIDTELRDVQETVAYAQMQALKKELADRDAEIAELKEQVPKKLPKGEIAAAAIRELRKRGYPKADAEKLVIAAWESAEKKFDEVDKLVEAALAKPMDARDLMHMRTMVKGDKGVAVMTEAASARGDNLLDRYPQDSVAEGVVARTSKPAIYHPDQGKMSDGTVPD